MDASNTKQPSWLTVLDEDDLQFLKRFLLCSGSLKSLAEEYSVSYPTVRARLDRLIAKVRAAEDRRIADPFERKLRVYVADDLISPSVAKQLLDAHRAFRRKEAGKVTFWRNDKMPKPWFEDPNLFGAVLGASFGIVAGTWGILVQYLAPRAKAETFVLTSFWLLFGVSAALLIAGVVAYFAGQPRGVWYGLGLVGMIGVLVMGSNGLFYGPRVLGYYREAEERRMKAQDLN